jgi:hypothetical protein
VPSGSAGVGASGGPSGTGGLSGGGTNGGGGVPSGVSAALAALMMILLWLIRHGDASAVWRSYLPEVSPA